MKVPPPPPPPPAQPQSSADRDRTLTRRTVKGAAGGMEGVDYSNDPKLVEAVEKGSSGGGSNRDSRDRDRAQASKGPAGVKERARTASEHLAGGLVRGDSEMVLEDEDATTRETKNKAQHRVVYRDRLTIDRDAPEQKRKQDWIESEDEAPDERHAPPEELDLGDLAEQIAAAGDRASERGHLFETGRGPSIGDARLTDPDQIQQAFGSPLSYARHVLILAEAFRAGTGASRGEAVAYLARLFVGLSDRRFARLAAKELGPGTGVLDIYPLELIEQLLHQHPGFLPKFGFGRLFTPAKNKTSIFHLRPGVPRLLQYPPDLRVRGFALKGGGRPGYRFEPGPSPGRYALTIEAPGEYSLLVSALTHSGHTIVDTIQVRVRGRANKEDTRPEVKARDQALIERWPMPTLPPIDSQELLEDDEPAGADAGLSSGEIVRRQQLDALRGPKGDAPEAQAREARPRTPTPLPEDEPEELSQAEAAMIWLALATHSQESDVIGPPKKKD